MRHSIITFLSDFGLQDHYVASVKGTILSINPDCTIVDMTHQIAPHDIREGAFVLLRAYSSFPKGTIHVAVVDPGVGGPRRPILFATPDYYFVGPDNGLFTYVLRREKRVKAVVLNNKKFFSSSVSTTFHARDIFGPVAAHLSLHADPERFGKTVQKWQEIGDWQPEVRDGELVGSVFHIDRFGNLISNIDREILFDFIKGESFLIQIGRKKIRTLKEGYWQGEAGEPMAVIGSGGFLEISMKEASAQDTLHVQRGEPIRIRTV